VGPPDAFLLSLSAGEDARVFSKFVELAVHASPFFFFFLSSLEKLEDENGRPMPFPLPHFTRQTGRRPPKVLKREHFFSLFFLKEQGFPFFSLPRLVREGRVGLSRRFPPPLPFFFRR